MLDYYTLQATLKRLSTTQHVYTPTDIAVICRAGKLTPLFAYNRLVTHLVPFNQDVGGYYLDEDYITPFNGYLTHPKIVELLDGYSDSLVLASAYIYNTNGTEYEKGENVVLINEEHTDIYQHKYHQIPISLIKEQLLFPRDEVEALANDAQSIQPSLELMHPRERNTAIKIMYALLIKSKLDNTAPTSQNAGSANCEIRTLLDQLGIPVGHETIGKFLGEIKDLSHQHPIK